VISRRPAKDWVCIDKHPNYEQFNAKYQ